MKNLREVFAVLDEYFGVFILVLGIGASGALFTGIAKTNAAEKVHRARVVDYLASHKCRVAGYAGKDATPYYQCDNGLIRAQDVP